MRIQPELEKAELGHVSALVGILLLLLEKTNLSCRKQASRRGYKVNKAIEQ